AIPRALFDYARALEGSYRDRNVDRYLKLARNKLKRLQAASAQLAGELHEISDHTNFKMAEASLRTCVEDIEKILAGLV
ncbi:MAG: amidohydrolase, partial [Planctomycetota bacterium]|nr:amidohydrolase [Planctomycetota bacterium]